MVIEVEGIARPALLARSADPARSGDDQVAADAEATVKNFFTLQEIYLALGKNGPKPSVEDQKWATESMRGESEALDRLIPALENIIQKNIQPLDAPAPKTYFLSLAVYSSESGSDDFWEEARIKSNLAATLAFIYRSRRSTHASSEDVSRAEASVPKLKMELTIKVHEHFRSPIR